MAEFVLNRKFVLRSLTGHTVAFEKGVPVFVPDAIIKEVIAIGGERIDAKQDEGFEEAKKKLEDPTGDERKAQVFKVFDEILATNSREDFTAQGAPHIKAIKERVGFTVDNKERDLLWAEYRIKKAEE